MAREPGGHLDDATAHAWLDGALSREDAAGIEAHVQTCDQCAETVARARGMIAAASRILGALDHVPVHVVPARARRRGVWWAWPARVAAALLVVAGGTVVVTRRLVVERPAVLHQLQAESKAAASPPVAAAPSPAPAPAPVASPAQRPGLRAFAPRASAAPAAAAPAAAARVRISSDSVATTVPQCFDVVAPASGAVAKRIVLDTGHAALVNAQAARWTAAGADSVEVVSDSLNGVRVEARIAADSMTGAASAAPNVAPQVFTAKKCRAPKSP
jgi:hypothetical protein